MLVSNGIGCAQFMVLPQLPCSFDFHHHRSLESQMNHMEFDQMGRSVTWKMEVQVLAAKAFYEANHSSTIRRALLARSRKEHAPLGPAGR